MVRNLRNGTDASPVCDRWNLNSFKAVGMTNLDIIF